MKITENKYFIFDYPRKVNFRYFARNIFLSAATCYYKVLMLINHPKKIIDKPYNVSICAMFKNEANYLKEWIEYNRIIGVQHFFLYNNFSSDNYLNVLKPYMDSGVVTLIDWPIEQGQLLAYCDCIEKYKSTSKWIGLIDIDEFIVPSEKENIYDILQMFEKKAPAVKFYWKVFGTSGYVKRNVSRLVTEDFICCWNKLDEVGKCFFNTSYDFIPDYKRNNVFHHFMWGAFNGVSLPPINSAGLPCIREDFNPIMRKKIQAQINHYYTKSLEEYEQKTKKGDSFFKINHHHMKAFYRHEQLCVNSDFKIYRFVIKLKMALNIDA
jgi:hypothetical protein